MTNRNKKTGQQKVRDKAEAQRNAPTNRPENPNLGQSNRGGSNPEANRGEQSGPRTRE
jgi:hypothetical protein